MSQERKAQHFFLVDDGFVRYGVLLKTCQSSTCLTENVNITSNSSCTVNSFAINCGKRVTKSAVKCKFAQLKKKVQNLIQCFLGMFHGCNGFE